MARMVPLWRACRHGKVAKMRARSWPAGQYMEVRIGPQGRIMREARMFYPEPGQPNPYMPIDPNEERSDWEEYEER